jgi:hypothetical protein
MPSPHFATGGGKRGTVELLFFQLLVSVVLPKVVVVRGIVPPPFTTGEHEVAPRATHPLVWIKAPVGTAAMLVARSFCRENSASIVFRTNDEYITLAPPRTTVVPLPLTSQAKPTRGEKLR